MRARQVLTGLVALISILVGVLAPGSELCVTSEAAQLQVAPGAVSARGGEPFAQVPPGHWSYVAIGEFERKGFADACPEVNSIHGRIVTRYEMAWIVSKLLDWAKQHGMDPDLPQGKAQSASSLQISLLMRLKEEFSDELALVAFHDLVEPTPSPSPEFLEGFLALSPTRSDKPGGQLTLSDLLAESSTSPSPSRKGSTASQSEVSQKTAQKQPEANKSLEVSLGKDARAELALGSGGKKSDFALSREGEEPLASLGVEYFLSDLMVRAAYSLAQLPGDNTGGLATRGTTSIGLDYRVPIAQGATFKAGYTYSRIMDRLASGASLGKLSDMRLDPTNPLGKSAAFSPNSLGLVSLGDGRKTTATFGLGYTIDSNISLALGYKLIDFSEFGSGPEDNNKRTNVASAELEIKF